MSQLRPDAVKEIFFKKKNNKIVIIKEKTFSHVDSLQPHRLYSPWNSPGQNPGVGSLSLLQGIFPTQGLNPGLSHCRRILYHLSQQGSPMACKLYLNTTTFLNALV